MNAIESKLVKVTKLDLEAVALLVKAGYDSPKKLKNASDADLMKVIKTGEVTALRKRVKAK